VQKGHIDVSLLHPNLALEYVRLLRKIIHPLSRFGAHFRSRLRGKHQRQFGDLGACRATAFCLNSQYPLASRKTVEWFAAAARQRPGAADCVTPAGSAGHPSRSSHWRMGHRFRAGRRQLRLCTYLVPR